jgi:predicted aldo/keto reductase-like oxidoreductase
MRERISRRELLGAATAGLAGGAAGVAAGPVETRTLGRTGARVPIVAMGCGESWWKAANDEAKALEALNLALDLGITYLDTGQTYGRGISESWIGKGIQSRRKDVFLSTKISTRDGEEALRETDRCLKRLQTSYLDILHIHNLAGDEDLAAIEKKGGLLDVVRRLRDEKIARFIGITSHTHPVTLRTAIERHDFDCVQMALNAAMQGYFEGTSSRPGHSFESIALPAAQKKGLGVIAMKVTGRNALVGETPDKASARDLIRYALSLPVSVAVIGMADAAHIRENAALARSFRPMPQKQMRRLAGRLAERHKAKLDRYFRNHLDG